MAQILVEKLRRSREQRIEVGGYVFIVRRPTDMEMIELQGKINTSALLQFVCGWEGVTELDIIPGGNPTPAEFSQELASEWLRDRPDLWGAVVDAVIGAYNRHAAELEERLKN